MFILIREPYYGDNTVMKVSRSKESLMSFAQTFCAVELKWKDCRGGAECETDTYWGSYLIVEADEI